MRLPRRSLTPETYRRLTLLALLSVAAIIVTGAAVRLTGSGLGCSDWPKCTERSFHSEWQFNAMVEFGNRLFTLVVSVAVILAVLGAHARVPRRRDLLWLAWGLVAGIVGQIVLGGLVVLFELKPPLVMGHFLLSMLLLLDAIVLHHRAGRPAGRRRPAVDGRILLLTRVLFAWTAVVVLTGTVVTAAGPNAGDEHVERLSWPLPDVTRLHSSFVLALVALTALFLVEIHRRPVPDVVRRSARLFLGPCSSRARSATRSTSPGSRRCSSPSTSPARSWCSRWPPGCSSRPPAPWGTGPGPAPGATRRPRSRRKSLRPEPAPR